MYGISLMKTPSYSVSRNSSSWLPPPQILFPTKLPSTPSGPGWVDRVQARGLVVRSVYLWMPQSKRILDPVSYIRKRTDPEAKFAEIIL